MSFKMLVTSVLAIGLPSVTVAEPGALSMQRDIKPLLKEYCFDCHNPTKAKGEVNLVEIADNEKLFENRELWEKVLETVESGDMPPDNKPQPEMKQRDTLLHYIEGQLAKFDCNMEKNPGRVTLRRLNKEEYRNTIRDLLRVDYNPEDFPNDEVGYGFDNIGDVLSLSPMLMEKFLSAAEEISMKAIAVPEAAASGSRSVSNTQLALSGSAGRFQGERGVVFPSSGEAVTRIQVTEPGEIKLKLRAGADQAGPEPAKMKVRLNDREVQVVDVANKNDDPRNFEVTLKVEPGTHEVGVAFLNDYSGDPKGPAEQRGDRNLYLHGFALQGHFAFESTKVAESHKQLITKMPKPGEEKAVAAELLRPFVQRAYRRPATEEELAKIVSFVEMAMQKGGTFLEGMQVAVQATLCSPRFLFRWELDPGELKPGEVRQLSDWEVASRLSYFLWNSMPDEQLFALAEKGELRKEGNLEKQVVRMMQDWRARQFVNNFAGQWLQIRNIWELYLDPDQFPNWKDDLKGLMKEEAERYFEAVMKEDRSVYDLIDSDFAFVNERLAKHYGIPGVQGSDFQRVQLPANSPRGGVITQGAVLLTTSTPTRTSPVIRGKWVLEQILGTPPPAAPPDVPPLQEGKQVSQSASLRKRLEQHMSQADCASCHKRMDPLGFALENFDASGAWREKDGSFPIDASGKLANGKSFTGPRELKTVLKSNNLFVKNLAEKMMIYALGRGLEYFDKCAVDEIVAQMATKENRFSALISGIVTSEPFLQRRKEGEALAQR
jgi:hypothetical protein